MRRLHRSTRLSTEPATGHFSIRRLDEPRAQDISVFVDFTADWWLRCKVSEQLAIDRAETQAAFGGGVVTLIADWMRSEPAIMRFLATNGRNSIPYRLFYARRGEAGQLP